MFLNDFIKKSRTSAKISQESFYTDIVSRATADAFEKKNADVLKVGSLSKMAEKLSLTVNELIKLGEESFLTDFENKNRDFLLVSSILSQYQTEETELTDTEIKKYLNEMDKLYTSILEKKETYSSYFNLYLLLKHSFHDSSSVIMPVDKTDITLFKKILKTKTQYTAYDYKAFANILISPFFSLKDIEFTMNLLFPLNESPYYELIDSAYLSLSNLTSKLLRTSEYELATKHLELFNKELEKNPSYYYRLTYLHDYYLLQFLKSKYENADALAQSLQFINIIELCEPPESSLGDRLRESTVNMVENKASSRSIINIIATTKNNIDFKKLIPEHIIKNEKKGPNL